ncbi:MAG: hypothetical protein JW953_18620 [Anaerolineae bacterium]|nr:hypothetical protein [Anaerolineae bacterium]
MSKKWKITIGVIIIIVGLVGLGMLRWGNRVYWSSGGERGWSLGAYAYQVFGWDSANYLADLNKGPARRTSPADVPLADDNGDGVPDRGRVDAPPMAFGRGFPGRGDRLEGAPGAKMAQVEVQLLDDNGDGIPDRGVIDHPAQPTFGRQFGPDRHFHREAGYRQFDRGFAPFLFIGGLFRLAFLALLVGVGVFFYRRWRANRSPAPVNGQTEA